MLTLDMTHFVFNGAIARRTFVEQDHAHYHELYFIRIISMSSVMHMSTTLFDGFDGSQLGHFIKSVQGLTFDGLDGFDGSRQKDLTVLTVPTKITIIL